MNTSAIPEKRRAGRRLAWRGALPWMIALSLLTGDSWQTIAVGAPEKARAARANRLAKETSPYLLAHAHNPVDWFPWGAEALEKAKQEDKPIFLSIGYSSCHWCHVMERNCFSDPEIARYMNENFINIKVDREERPDIDDIYMASLQMYYKLSRISQSGGWPLSMFLTPDGRPLGGATYLPPTSDDDGPTFPALMKNVVAHWSDPAKRKLINSNADILTKEVRDSFRTPPAIETIPLDAALVTRVFEGLEQSYDPEHGGFGFTSRAPSRPKFPVPPKLAFLQSQANRGPHAQSAAKMLALTLDRMAAGGIYDHVGGGFHRYSTDRYWRIPHFEKMLYDNAQLASIYTAAYVRTRNPRYRAVAEGTIEFVLRELTDSKGGFHTALDADSEGVEGKYYVWTPEQLTSLLSAEELGICQQVYGASGRANFEEGHVLQLVDSLEVSADKLQLEMTDLERSLVDVRRKLLRERVRRKAPARDDKILCGWNGLMIAALAEASVVFDRPEYLRAARTAAEFILRDMRQENGRMFRSYCANEPRIDAYLEDYALLVQGLLALERATGEERWANAARRITDLQLQLFWDDKGAGCFSTSAEHEQLLVRTKPPYDSVMPSGNSATVRNLLAIAELSGEKSYLKKAEATLKEFAPQISAVPTSMTYMAVGLVELLGPDAAAPEKPIDPQSRAPRGSSKIKPLGFEEAEREPTPAKKKKKPADKISARAFLSAEPLPPGRTCKVQIQIVVEDGWHIHSNPPGDPDGDIPTEIKLSSELGLELKSLKFPLGRSVDRGEDSPPARYLEGKVAVSGVLVIPPEAAGESDELVFEIQYQACNDAQCLPKQTLKVVVPIEVAKRAADSKPANEKLFSPPPATPERGPAKTRRG